MPRSVSASMPTTAAPSEPSLNDARWACVIARDAASENHVLDLAFATGVLDPTLMLLQPTLELFYFSEEVAVEAGTRTWPHPPVERQRRAVVFNLYLSQILRVGECGKFSNGVH